MGGNRLANGTYIIDTKIQTSGLSKDMKEISEELEKVADAAENCEKAVKKSFDDMGDTAKDTGKDIDKGITEPLEDVGEQAQKTGKDIDKKLKDPIEDVGKESDKTGEKVKGLGDRFKDLFNANLLADLAVSALQKIGEVAIDVGKEAVEAAAAIRAENAQFEQTFLGIEKTARESLNSIADETGITASRMQASYTSIYAFTKSIGADTDMALDISSRAMIVAADSAAYFDKSIEEVTETLQSFIKGNYENDAALNVSATEATRNAAAMERYAKSFDKLNETQRADVLLSMVENVNKLSGAYGQAAREADSWGNVTGELSEAGRQFLGVIGDPILESITPIIQGITDALNKYVVLRNSIEGTNPLADETSAMQLAAEQTAAAVNQLGIEYEEAREAARQSLDAQIGLFDKLVLQSNIGAKTIIENWQSQRAAFSQYAENLQKAVNMGLDEALVQQLSDGSTESMSILNALVNDTGVNVDEINAEFQGVSKARDTVASTMAEMSTDMSSKLVEMAKEVHSKWPEMSGVVGAEIANMQQYIDSLTGSTVYVDVIERYIGGGYSAAPYSTPTGYSTEPASAYALPANIPYLASGAVIPPNAPFMAVLGDQRHGTNIEAPLETIKAAVRSELLNLKLELPPLELNFSGDLAALARILTPNITKEQRRNTIARGL